MENELPKWAINKEKEGMLAFLEIVEEFGQFTVEFKKSDFHNYIGFEADVSWGRFGKGEIVIKFYVFWNFDQLFSPSNEKVDTWQFVFADHGFTMSSHLFYMELFQKLDQKLVIA